MSVMTSRTWAQHDAQFMELPLRQAPFGTLVVDRNGQLIGEGHNAVRSDLAPIAHGEVVAIRDAWRRVGT